MFQLRSTLELALELALQNEQNCSHKQMIGTMQLWLQNGATGQILTRN